MKFGRFSVAAKVNLGLKVLRKRPDGYHDIWTIMVPIDVYDTVELALKPDESEVTLVCNRTDVPLDKSNLAWKALEAYRSFIGWPRSVIGVEIRIDKEIPVGAGLGGGSADAAAVLTILNRLNPVPVPAEIVRSLAVRLGADVPFFLEMKPCIAEGIGDCLTPVQGMYPYHLVLIKPSFSVSTVHVYGSLELTGYEDFITNKKVLYDPEGIKDLLVNDLERVTIAEFPVLMDLKQWLCDRGALGALMSGSGPTVFGIFRTYKEASHVAIEARRVWDNSYWVRLASVVTEVSTA